MRSRQRVDCSRGCRTVRRQSAQAGRYLAARFVALLHWIRRCSEISRPSPPVRSSSMAEGATEPIVRRFVEIAGGRRADIVVFATGPSEIRFGDQNVILNPDWPRDRKEWSQYRRVSEDVATRRWCASAPHS